MARRVYLAPGLIRVSAPGYDAASAPIQGLLFSEAFGSLLDATDLYVSVVADQMTGVALPVPGRVPPILVLNNGGARYMFINTELTALFIFGQVTGTAHIRVFSGRLF
ncbi:hypothetical protein [Aurantimonas endophytica]|uniref:Uncharacterized protein n=1 Tax=Aurantimonas endophytica TaxID=1522175 RepID=A0A7W6MML8_9HYPH|nr:hypothetical protein [Aurantimonas endophytica]MBB4000977.1 hypothetical protein [Aurantimonas endophytica]MCO6403364.1 hypothetical protein [Aurantimonas endophytica]